MPNAIADLNNPFDPEIMTSRYVTVATLAIFIWELLINILNDYKILSKHRIRLPTVVYFISKLTTLGFIITTTIYKTAPVNSCFWLLKSTSTLFCLCVPSTSLLFFFRIRAVFDRNPWIVAFFGVLWLAVVATCVLASVGVDSTNIGSTKYCVEKPIKLYIRIATVFPVVNDTLVFLAITWCLYYNSYARPTLRNSFQVLIFGDYLPRFSRAILQNGQAYYLATVTLNLLAVIMLFIPSLPTSIRALFWVPNVILMNIMACRVFRNTILGTINETGSYANFTSTEQRAEGIPLALPLCVGDSESGRETQQSGEAISGLNSKKPCPT